MMEENMVRPLEQGQTNVNSSLLDSNEVKLPTPYGSMNNNIDKLKLQPVVSLFKIDASIKYKEKKPPNILENVPSKVKSKSTSELIAEIHRKKKGRKPKSTVPLPEEFKSQPSELKFFKEDFKSELCRICGEKNSKCTYIYSPKKKLDDIINKYLPISVAFDDRLPSFVCIDCLSVLIGINNLSSRCVAYDVQLRETLEVPETVIKTEVVHDELNSNLDILEVSDNPSPRELSSKDENPPSTSSAMKATESKTLPVKMKILNVSDVHSDVDPDGIEILSTFSLSQTTEEAASSAEKIISGNCGKLSGVNPHHNLKISQKNNNNSKNPSSPFKSYKCAKTELRNKVQNYLKSQYPIGTDVKILPNQTEPKLSVLDVWQKFKQIPVGKKVPQASIRLRAKTVRSSKVKGKNLQCFKGSALQRDKMTSTDKVTDTLENSTKSTEYLPSQLTAVATTTAPTIVSLKDGTYFIVDNKNYDSISQGAFNSNFESSPNSKVKVNQLDSVLVQDLNKTNSETCEIEFGGDFEDNVCNESAEDLNAPSGKVGNANTDNSKPTSLNSSSQINLSKNCEIETNTIELFLDENSVNPGIKNKPIALSEIYKNIKREILAQKQAEVKKRILKTCPEDKSVEPNNTSSSSSEDRCLTVKSLKKKTKMNKKNNSDNTSIIISRASSRPIDVLQSSKFIKKQLSVKVLVPCNKSKSTTSVEKAEMKEVIDTPVEIFMSKIKDDVIPSYFRVKNNMTFPTKHVEKMVLSTIEKMLKKQKKEVLLKIQSECENLKPTVFKLMSEVTKSKNEQTKCVKCEKMLEESELIGHVKYTHLFQCVKCKVYRHSIEALEYHNFKIHGKQFKSCGVCKNLVCDNIALCDCSHYFCCSVCGQVFLNYLAYMKHENKHFESDFLEYLYKLNPQLKNVDSFQEFLSQFLPNQSDSSLLDYFGDQLNSPFYAPEKGHEKVFCIKCLKLFDKLFIFRNHECSGEGKFAQIRIKMLRCIKCSKTCKTKLKYCKHYVECVDRAADLNNLLDDTTKYQVKCALCNFVYRSFEKFSAHSDRCISKYAFKCDMCHDVLPLCIKEKHKKNCIGYPSSDNIRKKSESLLEPVNLEECIVVYEGLPEETDEKMQQNEHTQKAKAADNNAESHSEKAVSEAENMHDDTDFISLRESRCSTPLSFCLADVSTEVEIVGLADVQNEQMNLTMMEENPDTSQTDAYFSHFKEPAEVKKNMNQTDFVSDHTTSPADLEKPQSVDKPIKKETIYSTESLSVSPEEALDTLKNNSKSNDTIEEIVSLTDCTNVHEQESRPNDSDKTIWEDDISLKVDRSLTKNVYEGKVSRIKLEETTADIDSTNQIAIHNLETNPGGVEKPKPEYIRKGFEVKILTTSNEAEQDEKKNSENESCNPAGPEPSSIALAEPEKILRNEIGNSNSKIISVTYSVFFTKVSGKLMPHHFRLSNPNLSETTKKRVCSVIHTMLRKERSKILNELKQSNLLTQNTRKTQNRKKLKINETPRINKTLEILRKLPPLKMYKHSKPAEKYKEPNRVIKSICVHCKQDVEKKSLPEHIMQIHMVRCDICNVYQNSPHELLNHQCLVHNLPYSTCKSCFKKFPEGDDASSCTHSYLCSICSESFSNWLEYLDHEMIHFNIKALKHATDNFEAHKIQEAMLTNAERPLSYTCEVCGRRFYSEAEMEACSHIYKCSKCYNLFNNYPLYITHGCSVKFIKPKESKKNLKKGKRLKIIHQCPICDDTFDVLNLFTVHYGLCAESSNIEFEDKDGNPKYRVKCVFCLTVFEETPMFHRHYIDCQKANGSICDNCEEWIANSNKENHLKDCVVDVLCANCGVSFSSREKYKLHLRLEPDGSVVCKTIKQNINTDDDFTLENFSSTNCHFCGKMFNTVKIASRHIKYVHLDKIKSCPVCRKVLKRSVSSLLQHRKVHTSDEIMAATSGDSTGMFKCMFCSKHFNSSFHKVLHDIYFHEKELYCCTNCGKEMLSSSAFSTHHCKHTRTQRTPKPTKIKANKYVCEFCTETFERFSLYLEHKRSHKKPLICEVCKKSFPSKRILKDHQDMLHFGTPSTCEFCGKLFSCEKYLLVHHRRVHNTKRFLCQTCGKTFNTPRSLRVHETVHTGIKPYSCDFCDMRFRLKTSQIRHQLKHNTNGEKAFACQYCNAKFTQFNNLHLHRRAMHPENYKYRCPNCGYGYNDERFFQQHVSLCKCSRKKALPGRKCGEQMCPHCKEVVPSLRLHFLRRTDQRPYHCKTCPKKFSYLCSLKNHEVRHLNNNKYRCKLCSESFLGLKQYSRHSQLKHNDKFELHCSYCQRGYNCRKFYNRHIQKCNENIKEPKYSVNSKKMIPRCTVCNKVFNKFSDLNIHLTILHQSQTYKQYQCQVCDSNYGSRHLLVKHARHHYKDRFNPGSFLCPKCKMQSYDFSTIMKHECPFASIPLKDIEAASSSEFPHQTDLSDPIPVKRRKSSKDSSDSDGENNENDLIDSDFEDEEDVEIEGVMKKEEVAVFEQVEEMIDLEEEVNILNSDDKSLHEEPEDFSNFVEATLEESANFIYHCSFCKANFETLAILQNHLRNDHNFDLSNLEFQII